MSTSSIKKTGFITELKDRDYQNRRNKMLFHNLEKDEEKLKKKLAKIYNSESKKMDRQIAQYYMQYGKDNVIEYRSLLKTLSTSERDLLIKDIDSFVNKYPQFENIKAVRESIYKLDRFEGLRVSIEMQQMEIAGKEKELMEKHLVDTYSKGVMDSLNRLGYGTNFNTFDINIARKFVNEKWIDGKSLSNRIYENRSKVAKFMTTEFRNGVIRGDTYKDISKNLIGRFSEVSSKQAMRLIRTEGTRVMNEATISTFESEFEEYRYSAIFDERTSQVCKDLDGRVFKMKERQAGVNFPPMHPNCRSSYDIEIPKEFIQQAFDKARASGEITDDDIFANRKILGIDNSNKVKYNDSKDSINVKDLEYHPKYNTTLSNVEVREWYHKQLDLIYDKIDKTKSVEEQARQAFDLRNKVKLQARDLMKDQEARKELDVKEPIKDNYEILIRNKMERKGLSREEANIDVLKTAQKSNEKYDKIFGLERRKK